MAFYKVYVTQQALLCRTWYLYHDWKALKILSDAVVVNLKIHGLYDWAWLTTASFVSDLTDEEQDDVILVERWDCLLWLVSIAVDVIVNWYVDAGMFMWNNNIVTYHLYWTSF